ncbi:4-(cytidine 5'-diphospho)-2-C-methyl-D-erythritol kinase [Kineosporia rhizophila]|uniref:4-(cytidine 5'-diphospho)-2-C-methyl-D-erythritol kinase n=1 Tax=Kineosporia TaxID=49184 RepID=UPI001E385C89|nr:MULTISPECIES: 4-(cytidine 5'-diphospho)-2-C-methyl-D-erythritol kinase [Kineosporia]MCE0535097.1 4-(cytidine 5'-diphospho)-2-C-methyl-D-erythritol kinase [Kineosporia rhizophila]GLY14618.1 4-diphosphocytidyl-2-C-methyl-D-erythritol kinase [Kineosporia sp. NBRC 101677]
MAATEAVIVRAPAKINLELRVGPVRDDGYHELATVFHAVALFDDLTARATEPGSGVSIVVDGIQADEVPTDGSNLAVKAAELLAAHIGLESADVAFELRKGIPVAGGMAGGSADAAAALVACDALWHAGLDREQLHGLAAQLGSDVPFSLLGGTAIGGGRGEVLTPVLARGEYIWVIALAGRGLSTPGVYGKIDAMREAGEAPPPTPVPEIDDALMAALRAGDAEALGATLHNELQPAALALAPELEQALEIGRKVGALGGIVSGSGPTTVFLARDSSHALDLAVALTASGAAVDVRRANGPVPGARLVESVRG